MLYSCQNLHISNLHRCRKLQQARKTLFKLDLSLKFTPSLAILNTHPLQSLASEYLNKTVKRCIISFIAFCSTTALYSRGNQVHSDKLSAPVPPLPTPTYQREGSYRNGILSRKPGCLYPLSRLNVLLPNLAMSRWWKSRDWMLLWLYCSDIWHASRHAVAEGAVEI